MKKILVINFGNSNEIIKSANYVQILKDKYPAAQVSILTDIEMKNLAHLINGLSQTYFLELRDISTTLNNPLYSDVFALNGIENNLSEVLTQEWDIVVNYDNSRLSSILASTVKTDRIYGSRISQTQTTLTCSDWSAYKNFLQNYGTNSLICDDDINAHIITMPNLKREHCLKVDLDFANIARRNFDKILLSSTAKKQFVGVQVSFDIESLKKMFFHFINETDFVPVFIHQSRDEDLKVLKLLNAEFNNKIISISADTSALTAVIENLSLYITDQAHLATIADLLNVKCIECLEAGAELHTKMDFSGKHVFLEESSKSKILDAVNTLNTDSRSEETLRFQKDDFGKVLISNKVMKEKTAINEIYRLIDLSLLGYKVEAKHYQVLSKKYDSKLMKGLALNFKEDLGASIKKLLASLRSVRIASNSKESMMIFLKSLDSLFLEKESQRISSSAVALFEHKVESLDKQNNLNENLRKIEILLFELKTNFQNISSSIDILTGVAVQSDITL